MKIRARDLSAIMVMVLLLFALLVFTHPDKGVSKIITGAATVDTRTVIIQKTNYSCNATLTSGLNLISIACIQGTMDVDYVLSSISGRYVSIHEYQPDTSDPWKSYNPSLPGWVSQDLTQMHRKKGYWLIMSDNATFILLGNMSKPNVIDMSQGWNLVGYPTNESRPSNTSFDTILPASFEVITYNATDALDHWKRYVNGSPTNDLNTTDQGLGYWINLNESATWVIDW